MWITIVLWQRDRRKAEYREQERALRDLVRQLDDLEGDNLTKIRISYMSEFLESYGGAVPLIALIEGQLQRYDPEQGSLDLAIDVGMMVRSWRQDARFRADSVELFYARSKINPYSGDNAILTPDEITKAEGFVLLDERIHPWLQGTRMSVWQIRKRKAVRWIRKRLRREPVWNTNNMMTLGNELAFPKQKDTPYPL
ncbi:hypothetical protein [Arthrobacter alpinus]|uniref:hypothetical protein n=1 Tax=Arthrobacter alpinus TaxID=656366 RepID=UPI001114A840|nr:hypothetical protein [Arthrobacter alpinus]